jgi:[ribosomal protein S5]-alanine N-acetyltransferase
MERFPELKGENIILRKPIEKDITDRYSCDRTPQWVRTLGGDTRNMQPMSLEEAEQ